MFDHIAIKAGENEEQDKVVSAAVAGAWLKFAKSGNPNGNGLPVCPAYKTPTYQFLNYGEKIALDTTYDAAVEFFQRVFAQMRGAAPNN